MEFEACFQYPIDAGKLLLKKARIRRTLKENLQSPIKKRIAVLGGSTTKEVVDQLELFLLFHGIEPEFYESEYDQFWQDAVFGNERLDAFSPDIVYLHTSWRNIPELPTLGESEAAIEEKLAGCLSHFEQAWRTLEEKFSCPIIQNNFDRPNYRLLGNRDVWDFHGRSNFISRLNQRLYQYAAEHRNFYINDLDFLAADFGLSQWSDPFYWHMYKYAMHLNAIPLLASSVASIIKAIFGKNKKALVLDLDNTLWGGVIGDDGQEGIAIGPEVPEGQVFSEFQGYCKALKGLGVVLMVNSKNEPENALLGLNHPDGTLRPEDFVAIKANWQPKNLNTRELAQELQLGADSFVFMDDNPAEREIVQKDIPGIAVPQPQRPEEYIRFLDRGGYFETTAISAEDGKKTEMYRANGERARQMSACASFEEYLESLAMVADIHPFDSISVSRLAQLTNKSNQFNLTTLRCTEEDISEMKDSDRYITLQGSLQDKFGDNGIVSVVAGEILGAELHIRLWLMSCRVLKRGMEDAMMEKLVSLAREAGLERIVGYYYPTAKNAMVKEFYLPYGFTVSGEAEREGTRWSLDLDKFTLPKHYIGHKTNG